METRRLARLLPFLAAAAFAAAPDPADEKAVLSAEKAWARAMISADGGALDRLLSDDLSYSHSSSRTETKADVIRVITSGSTKYERIEFRDTRLRQYGNVMVTTEKAAIRTTQSGALDVYVTHVWVKQKGGWRMVSRQATRLPQ
jgi:ketosteroid isomerase-like protein